MRANPNDLDALIGRHLPDQRDHFGRADIKAYNQLSIRFPRHNFF
jgi:hypothetical protein